MSRINQRTDLISTSLPIAMKSSSDLTSWISVFMEEEFANVQTQTLMRTKTRKINPKRILTWGYPKAKTFFTILFILSILTHYVTITTTHLILRPKNIVNHGLFISVICDVIYLLNLTFNSLNNIYKPIIYQLCFISLDIILIFPFWAIYAYAITQNDAIFLSLRLLSVLRLYHVPLYFSSRRNQIQTQRILLLNLEVLLYFFAVVHAGACCWFCFGRPLFGDGKDSRLDQFFLTEKPQDFVVWYFSAFYFSLLTNFGYGLILDLRLCQKIVVGLGIIFGFLLVLYYVANLFILSTLFKKRKLALNMQLDQLQRHCDRIGLDAAKRTSLARYYESVWSNKKGVRQPMILDTAPKTVRSDLNFDVNLPALQRSHLFKNCPEAYQRRLSDFMRHEFFVDGEFVYRQDEVKDKMIVVVSGVLEVLSEEDENSPVIAFEAGTCLGEAALVFTIRAKSSARAKGFVELQVLHRKDFYRSIGVYGKEHEKILSTIRTRVQDCRQKVHSHSKKIPSIKKIKANLDTVNPNLQLYRVFTPEKRIRFIDPDSYLYRIWETTIVLLTAVVCVTYPYYVAFHKKFPKDFEIFANVIEALYVLDLPLLLLCDKKKSSFKKILLEKFPKIYLDIFAAFYFELFSYLFENNEKLFYLFKLNRILKFYRFFETLHRVEEKLFLTVTTFRIIKALMISGLLTFWCSCGIYLSACFDEICTENSWYKLKLRKEMQNLTEEPIFENKFLFATYYSLSHLTNFEIHEIHPQQHTDKIFTSLLLILGVFFSAYCLTDIASHFSINLFEIFKYQKKIRNIQQLCYEKKMSVRLETRLMKYYNLQWDFNRKFELRKKLQLPEDTENEMLLRETFETLKTLPVFAEVEEDFVKAIALKSKIYVLPPGDIVTYHGSMNKEMFVIKNGLCVYKSSGGFYRRMGPNSHFGLCCLFFNLPEVMIVRTLTHCELISVDGQALQNSLNLYPDVQQAVKRFYKEIAFGEIDAVEMPELTYFENEKSRPLFVKWMNCNEYITKNSIINMIQFCDNHDEKYSAPFRSEDTFYLTKYILFPFAVLPEGILLWIWCATRLLVSVLYATLVPVQQVVKPHHLGFHYFLFALDFFTYADVYVMLHVGFYGDCGQLILHPARTAKNYANMSFVLDFLLCFPYELIVYGISGGKGSENVEGNPHWMYCAVRLVKIVQVYKVFLVLKRCEDNIYLRELMVILKFLLTAFFLVNFWTCLLIHLDCVYTKRHNFKCDFQSWIQRSKYENFEDFQSVYLISFYWTSNLMIGLNFGDLEVQGGNNLVLSVLIIISGALFYGYLLASLIPYALNANFKIFKYKAGLYSLVDFMKKENANADLNKKIVLNAKYIWQRTKGLNSIEIFSCLHTTLLQDTLSFLYEDTLSQVPLFKGLDRSFLRILAMIAKPQFFLEGQQIVRINEILDEFYILHRGTVEVDLENSTLRMDLKKGSLFGYYCTEAIPVMSINAVATSNVDVLCVRTVDYYNILRNYSKFNYKIKDVISEYKDFMPNKNFDGKNLDIVVFKKTLSSEKRTRQMLKQQIRLTFFDAADFVFMVASYVNSVVFVLQFFVQNDAIFFLNVALDLAFVLKLFLNFYHPFYDDYYELVTNKHRIKKRYLMSRWRVSLDFTVNLLPVITYTTLYSGFKIENPFMYYAVWRTVTAGRFLYVLDYFETRTDHIDVDQTILKLTWLFVWSSLTVHYLACFWYFLVCPFGVCDGNVKFLHEKLEDKGEMYIGSLFFVVNVLAQTGMTEIHLNNHSEIIFLIFLVIGSAFFKVLVLKDLIQIIWSRIYLTLKYEQQLEELEDYTSCAHVNRYQIRNILNYFKQLWAKDNGTKEPLLLEKLPSPLIKEVKIEIYTPLLSKSYLFNGTEPLFLRNISILFDRDIYFAGNVIVYDSQIDESMYFIKSGQVEIVTINANFTETVHDVLHEMETFGLAQGLFNNIPHHFTFRARSRVEILSLRLEKWDHLLRFYEKSKHIIYKRIRNAHMQLNK